MSPSLPIALTAPEGALHLVRHFGWNTSSFKLLESPLQRWSRPDAVVGYFDTGSAYVAAGAPAAAEEDLAKAVRTFADDAERRGRRAYFFGVEARFGRRVPGYQLLQVGEEPSWDPRHWDASLGRSRSLREQLRRARAKGVRVRLLSPADFDAPLRERLGHLSARWRSRQHLAAMGFLVGQDLYSLPRERLALLAEHEGRMVGLLSLVPIYARRGWLFEDLLRDPEAPNGTAELLVDAAMRHLGEQGCPYATLGLAPLAGSVPRPLRLFRTFNAGLYDFEGLRAFKARLRPHAWTPVFLAFPRGERGVRAVVESLRAFADGGLARFGARTLVRAPPLALRALSALLLPWMVALAAAPAGWFPSEAVRWGWVGFDALMAGLLWRLSRRWRSGLARALGMLAGLDAALTLLQLVRFNAAHLQGPAQWAVALVALAAPAAASALLLSGLRQRAAPLAADGRVGEA